MSEPAIVATDSLAGWLEAFLEQSPPMPCRIVATQRGRPSVGVVIVVVAGLRVHVLSRAQAEALCARIHALCDSYPRNSMQAVRLFGLHRALADAVSVLERRELTAQRQAAYRAQVDAVERTLAGGDRRLEAVARMWCELMRIDPDAKIAWPQAWRGMPRWQRHVLRAARLLDAADRVDPLRRRK